MIIAIKGTRMAAATELLLDAKLYPGLLLMGSELSGGTKKMTFNPGFRISEVMLFTLKLCLCDKLIVSRDVSNPMV